MYYFAKKPNGEEIVLTEREALIHSENNNVAQRMRLYFIGACKGTHTAEAKKEIQQMIAEKRPADYARMSKEDKNVTDAGIREELSDEIAEKMEAAHKADREEAEKNGFIPPSKALHIHTPRGDRQKIMSEMSGKV